MSTIGELGTFLAREAAATAPGSSCRTAKRRYPHPGEHQSRRTGDFRPFPGTDAARRVEVQLV